LKWEIGKAQLLTKQFGDFFEVGDGKSLAFNKRGLGVASPVDSFSLSLEMKKRRVSVPTLDLFGNSAS